MARIATTGYVIRRTPYSETSEVMHWLSPDLGLVATLARGIHRPTLPFGGPIDLLDFCAFELSTRSTPEGLALLVDVSGVRRWRELRTSSARVRAGMVALEVVRAFAQAGDPAEELCQALATLLDALCEHERIALLLAWFRLRVLVLAGFAPALEACAACGGDLSSSAAFSLAAGGALCASCARNVRAGERVPAAIRRTLALMAAAASPEELLAPGAPLEAPLAAGVGREITALVVGASAWALDRPLVGDRVRGRRR